MASDKPTQEGILYSLRRWGGWLAPIMSIHVHPYTDIHLPHVENSVPPTLLATLISAQHMRPFQPLPMMFPPVLLFSSYLNLSNHKTDAAGITAAWSGLYALLAMRRTQVSDLSLLLHG